MSEPIELSFDVTRDDWLSCNEAYMRDSPTWAEAARQYRRRVRNTALWMSPFVVIGTTEFIGNGDDTHGMYLAGAALGIGFAAFLYFALPRVNTIEKMKAAQSAKIRRKDYSPHTGNVFVRMDEAGVFIRSQTRELKLSWQAVSPTTAGGFIMLRLGGGDAIIIPPRAFNSEAAADEFFEKAKQWWEAGQLPHSQRLAHYLADRYDIKCPGCGYNLHGAQSEVCPECGRVLSLEEFTDSRTSRPSRM